MLAQASKTITGHEQVHEEFVRCSLQEAVSKYGQTAAKVSLMLNLN